MSIVNVEENSKEADDGYYINSLVKNKRNIKSFINNDIKNLKKPGIGYSIWNIIILSSSIILTIYFLWKCIIYIKPQIYLSQSKTSNDNNRRLARGYGNRQWGYICGIEDIDDDGNNDDDGEGRSTNTSPWRDAQQIDSPLGLSGFGRNRFEMSQGGLFPHQAKPTPSQPWLAGPHSSQPLRSDAQSLHEARVGHRSLVRQQEPSSVPLQRVRLSSGPILSQQQTSEPQPGTPWSQERSSETQIQIPWLQQQPSGRRTPGAHLSGPRPSAVPLSVPPTSGPKPSGAPPSGPRPPGLPGPHGLTPYPGLLTPLTLPKPILLPQLSEQRQSGRRTPGSHLSGPRPSAVPLSVPPTSGPKPSGAPPSGPRPPGLPGPHGLPPYPRLVIPPHLPNPTLLPPFLGLLSPQHIPGTSSSGVMPRLPPGLPLQHHEAGEFHSHAFGHAHVTDGQSLDQRLAAMSIDEEEQGAVGGIPASQISPYGDRSQRFMGHEDDDEEIQEIGIVVPPAGQPPPQRPPWEQRKLPGDGRGNPVYDQLDRLLSSLRFRRKNEKSRENYHQRMKGYLSNAMHSQMKGLLYSPGPHTNALGLLCAFRITSQWTTKWISALTMLIELVAVHSQRHTGTYNFLVSVFNPHNQVSMGINLLYFAEAILKEDVLFPENKQFIIDMLFRTRCHARNALVILKACILILETNSAIDPDAIPKSFEFDERRGWKHALFLHNMSRIGFRLPFYGYHELKEYSEFVSGGNVTTQSIVNFIQERQKRNMGLYNGLSPTLPLYNSINSISTSADDVLYLCTHMNLQEALTTLLLQEIHADIIKLPEKVEDDFQLMLVDHVGSDVTRTGQALEILQDLHGAVSLQHGHILLSHEVLQRFTTFPRFLAAIAPFIVPLNPLTMEECRQLQSVFNLIHDLLHHLSQIQNRYQDYLRRKIDPFNE